MPLIVRPRRRCSAVNVPFLFCRRLLHVILRLEWPITNVRLRALKTLVQLQVPGNQFTLMLTVFIGLKQNGVKLKFECRFSLLWFGSLLWLISVCFMPSNQRLTVPFALFLTPMIKLVWYFELKLVSFELRLLTSILFAQSAVLNVSPLVQRKEQKTHFLKLCVTFLLRRKQVFFEFHLSFNPRAFPITLQRQAILSYYSLWESAISTDFSNAVSNSVTAVQRVMFGVSSVV